jgi:hypothetical protein
VGRIFRALFMTAQGGCRVTSLKILQARIRAVIGCIDVADDQISTWACVVSDLGIYSRSSSKDLLSLEFFSRRIPTFFIFRDIPRCVMVYAPMEFAPAGDGSIRRLGLGLMPTPRKYVGVMVRQLATNLPNVIAHTARDTDWYQWSHALGLLGPATGSGTTTR